MTEPSFIGVFTITSYGISGNELPPAPKDAISRAIYSLEGEDILDFIARCNKEGIALRAMLSAEPAAPYSCTDSCSWKVYIAGTIDELLVRRKEKQA